MVQINKTKNHLHDLGYKIFLDRYAQKDMSRATLAVGDTVIVVVNPKTGQREIGKVTELDLPTVTIQLLDGEIVTRDLEHVDKPIEVDPAQMMDRVARGIAEVEKTKKKRKEWADNFRWLLEDWKFVPGGRILTGAGTDQKLTYYNCYVIPSPNDSRHGIIETLGQMTEIMSRGGGVGINLSTLRPRQAYVKGVNGRSSGSVSWGALYSFVTGLIEQGGCFAPDERILTDKGLIPAQEIADRIDAGETFYAQTHQGLRKITARFRNGIKQLYDVTTSRGYRTQITADHKVAVLMDGKIDTMALRYLQPNDEILLLLGEAVEGEEVALNPVQYERSNMSTTLNEHVTLPETLNADLAYLIGYMFGDGYVHYADGTAKAVKLATANAHPAIQQRLIETIQSQLNINPALNAGDGDCTNIAIYSRLMVEWLAQNGLLKQKSGDVRVPELIFRSPASVMMAFVAGYFDADGCNRGSKGGFGFDSISLGMLEDVQKLLIANGIVSSIRSTERNQQGWQTIYRLSVTGATFKARFASLIPAEKLVDANTGKRDMYQTYPAQVWDALEVQSKYRQRIYDGVSERISYGQMTKISERLETAGQAEAVAQISDTLHVLPDTITSITPVGNSDVFDFEVDDVHLLSGSGIYTSNSRRGALMLILNDWHPDVFDFINSKRQAGNITNANISVGISDSFMDAVKADGDWELRFPDTSHEAYDTIWDGDLEKWEAEGYPITTYKTIKARDLWNEIIESAWASAEPGVWFRERSNKMSNSWYFNPLISTNPCGEQSLGGFSVCNLGAINLSKFYDAEKHDVAWDDLGRTVEYAVRFLDNVIDNTPYFFEENAIVQGNERRVGLGTMGIAELMIYLQIRYGSDESVQFIEDLYKFIAVRAYETSSDIAKEKGAFPKFDAEKLLQSGFMVGMPEEVRERIRKNGLRNVTLLTQAPTGTTGTMVNTSTGIEPFFSWVYYRKSRLGLHEEKVPIVQEWLDANPDKTDQDLPDYFVTAMDLAPRDHIRVQAAFQRWIDSAISKTANIPNNYTIEQTRELYEYLYDLGCKGGTIYRDGSRDEQVLMLKGDERAESEAEANKKSTETAVDAPISTVATPHHVDRRPEKLHGVTAHCSTPFGTAYVTMNSDEYGNPFEVFITAPGKAGSDLQADAEGLGRMISLSLRTTERHNRREMIRLIIDQLRDIGGSRSVGFGPKRVISLPDSVARALEEQYFPQNHAEQLDLPMIEQETITLVANTSLQPQTNGGNGNGHANGIYNGADVCPSCGTISLIRAEGCRKCLTCGYSEC
jgi:ribonucleoside-diphosphate reductase alpha chain